MDDNLNLPNEDISFMDLSEFKLFLEHAETVTQNDIDNFLETYLRMVSLKERYDEIKLKNPEFKSKIENLINFSNFISNVLKRKKTISEIQYEIDKTFDGNYYSDPDTDPDSDSDIDFKNDIIAQHPAMIGDEDSYGYTFATYADIYTEYSDPDPNRDCDLDYLSYLDEQFEEK